MEDESKLSRIAGNVIGVIIVVYITVMSVNLFTAVVWPDEHTLTDCLVTEKSVHVTRTSQPRNVSFEGHVSTANCGDFRVGHWSVHPDAVYRKLEVGTRYDLDVKSGGIFARQVILEAVPSE